MYGVAKLCPLLMTNKKIFFKLQYLIYVIQNIMLMTKITSGTTSECILDISIFLARYFENRKYVFPNNKLVASFTLSLTE